MPATDQTAWCQHIDSNADFEFALGIQRPRGGLAAAPTPTPSTNPTAEPKAAPTGESTG